MNAVVVIELIKTLPISEIQKVGKGCEEILQRVNRPAEIDYNTKLAMKFRKAIITKGILKYNHKQRGNIFYS